MLQKFFLPLILLVGCQEVWRDETPVRAVVSTSIQPLVEVENDWRERLRKDVDEWNDLLVKAGCKPPFKLDQSNDQAKPVVLLPQWEWQWPDSNGDFFGDSIKIISLPNGTLGDVWTLGYGGGNEQKWNVLKHELGHALGLEHADRKYGLSVMLTPVSITIQPRDVEAAACRLGCGPCRSGTDPYNLE